MKSIIIITVVLVFLLVPISAYSQTSSGIATGMSYSVSPNKTSLVRGEAITITLEHGIQSGEFALIGKLIGPGGDVTELDPIIMGPGDTVTYYIDTNDKSDFPTTGKYILRLMLAGEVLDIPIIIQSAVPSTPTPTPTSTPTPTPTPTPSGASVSMGFVIVAVALAVAAVGIGIAFSKRKKAASVIVDQPAKAQAIHPRDDTQFWVCPNCGNDTQMKDGRQYCFSCKIYLSI